MTREEAITKIDRLRNEYNDQYIDYCGTNEAVNMAIEALKAEPVRHGHWIDAYPKIEPNPMFQYGICSVCGYEQSVSKYLKFCPNCGAKMGEEIEK